MIGPVHPKSPGTPAVIVGRDTGSGGEVQRVTAAMPSVWMRLLSSVAQRGAWVNMVRAGTEGFISRRHHPAPVHGYGIKRLGATLKTGLSKQAPWCSRHPESVILFLMNGSHIELDELDSPTRAADVRRGS